jgi:hypothetical protein
MSKTLLKTAVQGVLAIICTKCKAKSPKTKQHAWRETEQQKQTAPSPTMKHQNRDPIYKPPPISASNII